ncbi:hypothetical protein ANN_04815 [Periplaneta americana]|uniref:Uncharacterized protein n=1 Tax=Periplaneta americana TaxID=6978 RepID=A0ABQ8TBE1_PERAM|nr:hypothetical protein ANN_04815 [Periplaneta americana]
MAGLCEGGNEPSGSLKAISREGPNDQPAAGLTPTEAEVDDHPTRMELLYCGELTRKSLRGVFLLGAVRGVGASASVSDDVRVIGALTDVTPPFGLSMRREWKDGKVKSLDFSNGGKKKQKRDKRWILKLLPFCECSSAKLDSLECVYTIPPTIDKTVSLYWQPPEAADSLSRPQ